MIDEIAHTIADALADTSDGAAALIGMPQCS